MNKGLDFVKIIVKLFKFSGRAEGEFDRPIGITTTLNGEVIVADTWNHRLQVFDLEGNFIKQIGKRGTGAWEVGQAAWGMGQAAWGGVLF